jgi:hypothetical protein
LNITNLSASCFFPARYRKSCSHKKEKNIKKVHPHLGRLGQEIEKQNQLEIQELSIEM